MSEVDMNSMFQENLKKLTKQYTQKGIADRTGFSQSSINNYLSKVSEPSIQFLIALKDAFGISVDDFLFSDFNCLSRLDYIYIFFISLFLHESHVSFVL